MQTFLRALNSLPGLKQRRVPGLADLMESNPRCSWYPSAGTDLRDLLYLSECYKDFIGREAFEDTPKEPEIFIHTDYQFDIQHWTGQRGLLYADNKTWLTLRSIDLLGRVNLPLDEEIVLFGASRLNNYVLALRIGRYSENLGRLPDAWLIYVVCENAAFCDQILLEHGAQIETVIHVRYGGGLGGGGRSNGSWLVDVLPQLGTRLFINEGRYHNAHYGDVAAIERWPRLAAKVKTRLHQGHTIPSRFWSNHANEVMWCSVRSPNDPRPDILPTPY